ncbi:DUF4156 domain-containing protein [Aliikangiella coralliicola]|uniref:DUF4156 domain-containing protein n=1 Tax=Aliikangiella coralliicola TaxID=2592383 RepID=A0A545UHS7_9GAMM|nr:DUF4156 domain-containing protein [Aliikangiella coralliicola]TQV89009.1 DUF4156 domain-containing protein [Aliikangiella coralliicola]
MKKLVMITVALSLTACQAIKLSPGARLVKLTHNEPGKECQFLGDITGNQGDFFTGGFTSNKDLETGARNDLKNKAYAMGGNTIYILTQRAGQTGSYDHEYGGGSSQTNVTLSGNVYKCPTQQAYMKNT